MAQTRPLNLLPRRAGAFALLFVLVISAHAQAVPWATTLAPAVDSVPLPEDSGADGLAQTLGKLRTWGSLLMIVAHPDDEDGGMMAYESRGAGVRTALLTLTRGEGGQNALSAESYDALGLIRTSELLAADRYSGTEQLWGTEADYGFSKTKEEAFAQWGHERVLRDAVRAVREQRPLVLTSVFLGAVTDGHGHHQVAGEIAQEAFTAAGDPSMFPEQIAAGLRPWKPFAVFARVPFAPVTAQGMYDYATDSWAPPDFTNYVTGEHSARTPAADIDIPEGRFDPVLGRSYLQMAREGWGLQKSQNGGGNPPLAGPDVVSYHRVASRFKVPADASGFFSGIDVTLRGMAALASGGDTAFLSAGLERMERAATHAFWGYTPAVPARILPDLRELYLATAALRDTVAHSGLSPDSKADLTHELDIKLVQCNTAMVEALGLHLDALVTPTPPRDLNGAKPRALGLYPELTRAHVTPGEAFDVRLHITAAGPWSSTANGGLALLRTGLETPAGEHWEVNRISSPGMGLAQSSIGEALFTVTVPRAAAPTAPPFTRPSIAQPFYDVSDPAMLGRSFAPYPVSGFAEFQYEGVPLRVAEVVQGREREHGRGDFATPLVVTPGVSITLPQAVAVRAAGDQSLPQSLPFDATISNEEAEPADVVVSPAAPAGWQVEPPSTTLSLAPGEQAVARFVAHPPAGPAAGAAEAELRVSARSGNTVYSSGFTSVGYPGVRPSQLYRPAVLRVRTVDVQIPAGLRIAYVPGTGDEIPAALRGLGIPVDTLSASELLTSDLKPYTAVVLGVRTYTAHPELERATGVLQAFASAGGTVLIQYQSADFPGLPFALHLGGNPAKVVDEHSPVSFPTPGNAVLEGPNRISAADFDGWVEERGHGFAASWARQWTPLVSTEDPGQAPQLGGLLVAPLGRGRYIYDSLALYRQLPEGVPGAFRLLVNLVSAKSAVPHS